MRASRQLRLDKELLVDLGTDELAFVAGDPGPEPTPPYYITLPVVGCPQPTPPYSNHC